MNNYRLVVVFLSGFAVLTVYLHLYIQSTLTNLQRESASSLAKSGGGQAGPNRVLIYNRVPKTGSTSLMNIAYELNSKNRYRVVQLRLINSKHVLTAHDQIAFSKNMSDWSDMPLLFHGHFSYFDPRSVGFDISPIYINLIREPLERLVSYYYFLRYGDDVLDKVRAKQGDTTTFDECVEKAQPDCEPKKLWMQIPFFCGTSPHCWDIGSHWALEQAKQNLVNKYLVVGVTAEFESFVEVLETLIPDFFRGAQDYLRETGKAHIKKTKHKDVLSDTTMGKMKSSRVYQMEMEFYQFALKQFKAVRRSVNLLKQQKKAPTFVYEKIRPKA